jgi:hypothetical protein
MYEDLRGDVVGQAICALRKAQKWNIEKHQLKDELLKKLKVHKYVKSVSTRSHFRMVGGVGFSYVYSVPLKKRGRFEKYSGKLLRLVYVASAKDYLEIRFGVVDRSQIGRSLKSMKPANSSENFDPRRYYQFLFGEHGYLVKSG